MRGLLRSHPNAHLIGANLSTNVIKRVLSQSYCERERKVLNLKSCLIQTRTVEAVFTRTAETMLSNAACPLMAKPVVRRPLVSVRFREDRTFANCRFRPILTQNGLKKHASYDTGVIGPQSWVAT